MDKIGQVKIPEERIRHFGKNEDEKIETSSCEVQIFTKTRKIE